MSKTFKQYKGAWAKHLYPPKNKKRSTYKTSGCGPTSVADIVYNVDKNITPEKVGKYISSINGVTQGGATYHDAIAKALKHYGFEVKVHAKMSTFLAEMKNGAYGIICFRAGTKGGVKWTGGGHYVAATSFRGKDELYMRDSGTRGHIGWYSYSKHMKGLCKWAVTCKLKKKEQKKAPQTPLQGSKLALQAEKYAYVYKTSSVRWNYAKGKPKANYVEALKKYLGKTARESQSDCGYFVSTVVRSLGIDKNFLALKGNKDKFPTSKAFDVVIKGRKLKKSELKAGDIIRYKKTNGGQHTYIYLRDNLCAEAGRKVRFPVVRNVALKCNDSNVKHNTIEVLRAKEVK